MAMPIVMGMEVAKAEYSEAAWSLEGNVSRLRET